MSYFQFPEEYDPDLDPTPEDEEYTPDDLLVMLLAQLATMQADRFNLFRADDLPRIQRLRLEGVEKNGMLVFPADPEPEVITDWNDDGYSEQVANYCVQNQVIRETAELWRGSGNRLLRQSAVGMRKQWYMLPLPRLMSDDDFRNRYLANGYANLGQIMGFTGRGGYQNRPVFENVIATPFTNRIGQEKTKYQGVGVIDDHHQPITGTNMFENVANIVGMFDARYGGVHQQENNGLYQFLVNGSREVFEMDNDPSKRTTEWRRPIVMDKDVEREDAWQMAKQL
jgi:hypothetical protein